MTDDARGDRPLYPTEPPTYPSSPPLSSPFASATPQPPAPASEPAEPYVTHVTTPPRHVRFLAVAIAVVGFLGAAAFAVTSVTAVSGASSPSAAADALFGAASHEDLIGVLDALPKSERDLFIDPARDVSVELTRIGVLADGVKLDGLKGFDLEFTDVQYEVTELADGIAAVKVVGGTSKVRVIPSEVPVGGKLRETIEDLSGEPLRIEASTEVTDLTEGDPVTLVAIKDDGWHISLGYSLAEAARDGAGEPQPDFGHGVQPAGAATPEAALEGLIRAGADFDLRRVIALLPPDEMRALQDYAPLFLDDVEKARTEADGLPTIKIKQLETTASIDGDTAVVQVTKLDVDVSGTLDGETFSVKVDGDCATFTINGEEQSACAGQEPTGKQKAAAKKAEKLIKELPLDLKAFEDLGVVTTKVDGKWYVSPVRTVLSFVVTAFQSLHDDALDRFVVLFGPDGTFFEDFFGDSLPFGDTTSGFAESGTVIGGPVSREDLVSILDATGAFDSECVADALMATLSEGELEQFFEVFVTGAFDGPSAHIDQVFNEALASCGSPTTSTTANAAN
jgi:hypothetical protein